MNPNGPRPIVPLSATTTIPPENRPRAPRAPELDGSTRVQMIVALVLGVVLVVIPIYLLQRPRTIGDPIAPAPESSATNESENEIVAADAIDAGPAIALSEPKILSCHDAGKKTAVDVCDNPAGLTALIKNAILEASSCVPPNGNGGTNGGAIAYAIDLTFSRKKNTFSVSTPKDGRTMKSPRVAQRCASAVHEKLDAQNLDSMKHEHARYHVSVVATYPGPIE